MNYFDYNATTPVAPEVREVLVRALDEAWGNPSSIHAAGQRARQAVELARRQVAAALRCEPKEIVFTSGGTEGDNLAILGAPAGHVIISAIEHPAVLGAAEHRGNYTIVPVTADGVVDPEDIRRALRADTVLVSVMHANNETGAIQPLAEISKITREAGVLLHSDGVQAAKKIDVDVHTLGVDLYTITGHKFGAPKGAGALFVREGVKLTPLQFGGRHERERRAGTENVAGIAALGAGCALPIFDAAPLRDRLEQATLARIPNTRVHAAASPRTPNTTNIAFEGIEAEALVIALDLAGFAVSTGAACSSGAVHASHVLTAMGIPPDVAKASIRFSVGRANTAEQVDALVNAVETAVARLRKLAPAHV